MSTKPNEKRGPATDEIDDAIEILQRLKQRMAPLEGCEVDRADLLRSELCTFDVDLRADQKATGLVMPLCLSDQVAAEVVARTGLRQPETVRRVYDAIVFALRGESLRGYGLAVGENAEQYIKMRMEARFNTSATVGGASKTNLLGVSVGDVRNVVMRVLWLAWPNPAPTSHIVKSTVDMMRSRRFEEPPEAEIVDALEYLESSGYVHFYEGDQPANNEWLAIAPVGEV